MQHAIELIADTIGRIGQIATTIAAAVKEQGAVTQEIVRSVQQAPGARSGTSSHTCTPARSIARQNKNPRAFLQRGFSFGGPKRDRTADLHNAIVALS